MISNITIAISTYINMDELLTTRQVQEILKVDRITIYRMLRDGRLKGVKIGQQWRFPQSEVNRLLGRRGEEAELIASGSEAGFPIHCMQTIQDLFSEVSQIPAVVVDMEGQPLTQPSSPCAFCQAIMGSQVGGEACRASWRSFAVASQGGSQYFACHAGLQYVGAPLVDKSGQVGLFLVGQIYWQAPDLREESERVRRLAQVSSVPASTLLAAAASIQVIPPEQHEKVESWPFTAARAINSILRERVGFIERLQQIANLTQIP
jgi:excisionase family DNA binding protein